MYNYTSIFNGSFRMKTNINLDKYVVFYDPHPGLAGSAMPLPKEIKNIVKNINRETHTLRSVINDIKKVKKGEVSIYGDSIMLIITREIGTGENKEIRKYSFRLISFKEPKN